MLSFQGALIGGILSGCLVAWMSIGTQLKMAQRIIRFVQKPVSVEGCNANWIAEYLAQITAITEVEVHSSEPPFILYRMSYMYYTMVGTLMAIVVGLVVSYFTGGNKKVKLHRDLFSPLIHRFLKDEFTEDVTNTEIEMANVKNGCTNLSNKL